MIKPTFYMECDGNLVPGCWREESVLNDSFTGTKEELIEKATRSGWRGDYDSYYCPSCVAVMGLEPASKH